MLAIGSPAFGELSPEFQGSNLAADASDWSDSQLFNCRCSCPFDGYTICTDSDNSGAYEDFNPNPYIFPLSDTDADSNPDA